MIRCKEKPRSEATRVRGSLRTPQSSSEGKRQPLRVGKRPPFPAEMSALKCHIETDDCLLHPRLIDQSFLQCPALPLAKTRRRAVLAVRECLPKRARIIGQDCARRFSQVR